MFDPRQKRTLATVFLGMFLAFLDGTVVNLALPVIQQDLQAGIAELQWIVDGYILAYAAFMLTGGSLGDRYGRKRLFVTGLSVFVVASLVCALAPNTAVLVSGRVLQGLGGALFVPGTLAILAHAFPDPRQRAQAIGIWSSVAGLSMALGPLVGGVLVESFGWQSIFLANLPFGALVVFLALRWLTESSAPQARHPDLPGQVLAVVTLAALVYALIAGGDRGWGSPLILGLLGVAAVGAAVFLAVEARTGEPMLPLGLFRSRSFAACVVVALLVGFGLLGSFFFLSLFLQNVQGFTSLEAGVLLLPAVLAVSACAPVAGRLAGRHGPRWLMAAGMTVVGLSLLAFSQVGPDTSYAVWWPILFGIGAGVGLTMTPMIATIVGSVPPPQAGLASATGNTGQQVGGMLGIAGLGTVIAGHFPEVFREKTASLGLPESVSSRIAQGAETGTMPHGIALPDGVDPEVVSHWVRFAFVEGMQRALTIAGFLYLAGALLAVAFVRMPRPPGPPAADPAAADPATGAKGTTDPNAAPGAAGAGDAARAAASPSAAAHTGDVPDTRGPAGGTETSASPGTAGAARTSGAAGPGAAHLRDAADAADPDAGSRAHASETPGAGRARAAAGARGDALSCDAVDAVPGDSGGAVDVSGTAGTARVRAAVDARGSAGVGGPSAAVGAEHAAGVAGPRSPGAGGASETPGPEGPGTGTALARAAAGAAGAVDAAGTGAGEAGAARLEGRARGRHVRTAMWIDVPVAALLLTAWFTIPLPAAHLALGVGFQLVVLAHLATRPDRIAGVLRAARAGSRPRPVRRPRLRLTADAVLVTAAVGVTVSGFLQWARPGVEAYAGLHSFTSGVVLVAAGRHVWVRRAVLLRRLRGRRRGPRPVLVVRESRSPG